MGGGWRRCYSVPGYSTSNVHPSIITTVLMLPCIASPKCKPSEGNCDNGAIVWFGRDTGERHVQPNHRTSSGRCSKVTRQAVLIRKTEPSVVDMNLSPWLSGSRSNGLPPSSFFLLFLVLLRFGELFHTGPIDHTMMLSLPRGWNALPCYSRSRCRE